MKRLFTTGVRASVLAALLSVLLSPQFASAQSAAAAPAHDGHAAHGQHADEAPPPAQPATEHSHATGDEGVAPQTRPADLPPFIPRLTDADRQAAFPDLAGHSVSNPIRSFVLVDRFEWQTSDETDAVGLNVLGWIGHDRDRLWFRGEGTGEGGDIDEAQAHVLWGRQVARWWDVVAGIRQDAGGPGDAQTWAAVGVQGLAPYWFDLEATAYVGGGGRTQFRVDVGYELLLTNRWILQPNVEANFAGKADPDRQTGAGLMSTDVGLRLRYEIRRELAPYAGVVWRNTWQGTADRAEAAGEDGGSARVVAGLRFWW